MRNIAPRIAGADEFDIAEEQHQYKQVVACLVRFGDGTVARVLRYAFNATEREAIARGEDIYFGTPASQKLQPHWFSIGFPPTE